MKEYKSLPSHAEEALRNAGWQYYRGPESWCRHADTRPYCKKSLQEAWEIHKREVKG